MTCVMAKKVKLLVCSSYVVYNAATHSMLTSWDDSILYPVSFWCVFPNVSNHEFYFSIKELEWFLFFFFAWHHNGLDSSAFCFCFVSNNKSTVSPLQLRRFTAADWHIWWVSVEGKDKRMWSPFVKCVRRFSQHRSLIPRCHTRA